MKYIHIGLNVTSLESSIEFYSKLFNASPVKVKPDYAKFLLEEPAINFTLNLRSQVTGNQVGHFGFQVQSEGEIHQQKDRLQKAGVTVHLEEEDTTCCYAVQDKFWVKDPDGNEWEFFYTKQDAEEAKSSASTCCASEPAAVSFDR